MFFLAVFFGLQVKYTNLQMNEIVSNCIWFFIFYPLYNYICVRSLDGVVDNFKNLKTRILCLFSRDTMEKLRGRRTVLAHKVHETINRYGPKVFENFDKMKLVKGLKKKPMKVIKNDDESDNESSKSSFKSYLFIDEMDFDDAFRALSELGL